MKEGQRVGEVIEASTTVFTAQCYELFELPPFGSLVKTKAAPLELYGIVYNATTGSIDPGRRAIARGKNETSEEAIYSSSPQLKELLCSDFTALVTGYRQDNSVYHYLPPVPAHIHGFVHLCSQEETREFSSSLNFLNILINTHLPLPPNELVAASLRYISQAHEDRRAFLVAAGKELAVLLGSQYDQLRTILGGIRQ